MDMSWMEGVDHHELPFLHRAALCRVNHYRAFLGLPAYRYDHSLSVMGDAHVKYVLDCTAEKLYCWGHWENKAYKQYTEAGHEAASTSGIGGGKDALDGLEALCDGTFHRTGFIGPTSRRTGVSHGHSSNYSGQITLLVNRKVPEPLPMPAPLLKYVRTSPVVDPKLYIVFPPPGFPDARCAFHGEWPDPRPTELRGAPTGFLCSIWFQRAGDNDRVIDSSCVFTDLTLGQAVDVVTTDAAHPANPVMTQKELDEVYGPGKSTNVEMFKGNGDSIHIIPKAVLHRGHEFDVNATVRFRHAEFGAAQVDPHPEVVNIRWQFKTRPPVHWHVKATPQHEWQSWEFASLRMEAGDYVHLSPGVHEFSASLWLPGVTVMGSGAARTLVRRKAGMEDNIFCLVLPATFSDFTFDNGGLEKSALLWCGGDSDVLVQRCKFINFGNGSTLAQVCKGGRVEVQECDFSDYIGNRLAGVASTNAKQSTFINAESNRYGFANPKIHRWNDDTKVVVDDDARHQPVEWQCNAAPSHRNEDFMLAIETARQDDVITLAAGTYRWTKTLYYRTTMTLRGAGMGNTIITIDADDRKSNRALILMQCHCLFQDLTIMEPGIAAFEFLAVQGDATAVFERVQVISDNSGLFWVAAGSEITLRGCDMTQFAAKSIGWVHVADDTHAASQCHNDISNAWGYRNPLLYCASKPAVPMRLKPIVWPIAVSATNDGERFSHAVSSCRDGDVIAFAEGVHMFTAGIWIPKELRHFRGVAGGKSILRRDAAMVKDRIFCIHAEDGAQSAEYLFEDLTIELPGEGTDLAYISPGATVRFLRCKFLSDTCNIATVCAGAALTFDSCDFTAFVHTSVAWCRSAEEGRADGVVIITPSTDFGFRSPMIYGAGSRQARTASAVWAVHPNAATEREQLGYALKTATKDDQVQLAEGVYELAEVLHLKGISIVGTNAHKTVLKGCSVAAGERHFNLGSSHVTFKNVTLQVADGHDLFWLGDGYLTLEGCILLSGQQSSLMCGNKTATLEFINCDLTHFASDIGWFLGASTTQVPTIIGLDTNHYDYRVPKILIAGSEAIHCRTTPAEWRIAPQPSHDGERLSYALASAIAGDTILLCAGRHVVTETTWIQRDSVIIRGEGAGKTTLERVGNFHTFCIPSRCKKVLFQAMTLKWAQSFHWFYSQEGTHVELRDCVLVSDEGPIAQLSTGCKMDVVRCDLRLYEVASLGYQPAGASIECIDCVRK
eukprot:TRINITY_DN4162_c0_g1_i2.p1 TRINITY_DN4162_c0_g1~~TRINITY_DN4162_c0_g1_i2.p1  ORF type:complete len:1233 (+),score=251.82 TRINITY_DN4162_c0_g1_i2:557-4255(+)